MIDWSKRITKDNKIDISGLPYYYVEYSDKPKKVRIDEHDVDLPKEPKDENCINFGLPIKDQKFRKIYIPTQVLNPDRDYGRDNWSEEQKESFIDHMWNIRLNGYWCFIKGKKMYIHPLLFFKLNFTDTRGKFIFKYSDWEFFMFWNHCLRNIECKGMVDFKCRQLGDTHNAITIIYEFASRMRGSLNTMQSAINEDNISRVFDRIVEIHKGMIYFFKPIHSGSEEAKGGKLTFRYPIDIQTSKKVRERHKRGELIINSSSRDYQYPELNSQIMSGTTKERVFDGSTDLGRVYLDEYGKPKQGFSPTEWLRVMIEAIYSKITNKKTGMIIMTSTVDEITPESLEESMTIYREADPNKRLSDGSTVNGLFRIFRGVVARGEVDEFGFPLSEKILNETTERYNAMLEAGNIKGALSYIQKNPRTIDDVFVSVNNQSQFHIENLTKRKLTLDMMNQKPYVRGNLKWKDGIKDSEVIWEPNPKGKFVISKHPSDFGLKANNKVRGLWTNKPANTAYFAAGVDPIDQKYTVSSENKLSKAAFSIGRKPDYHIDGIESRLYQYNDEIKGIQKGDPIDLGAYHETNRICCTYLYRPDDPAEFFEDLLMAIVYYGCEYLPEKNKSAALDNHMEQRGYGDYLMARATNIANSSGKIEKGGVTMTDKSGNAMFDYITTYTCKMVNAIDHPDVIDQLLTMNWKNRTEKDLGVAFGWMLYAFNNNIRKNAIDKETESADISHWEENIV